MMTFISFKFLWWVHILIFILKLFPHPYIGELDPFFVAVLLVRTWEQVHMFGRSALLFSFPSLVWYYFHFSSEICRLVPNISILFFIHSKAYFLILEYIQLFIIRATSTTCDLSQITVRFCLWCYKSQNPSFTLD